MAFATYRQRFIVSATKLKRSPGRPLSFDREHALRQAMLQFWRHGYESTSVSDLTSAMGITAPSLYAAFIDKKQLFREAVQLYLGGRAISHELLDDAATARDAAHTLLQRAAIAYTGNDTPRGCLLATATISCSEEAADLQRELASIRREFERHLCKRIRRGIEERELRDDVDAEALAGHIMAVVQGMSTLARDGASRSRLSAIADNVIRSWPAAGHRKNHR